MKNSFSACNSRYTLHVVAHIYFVVRLYLLYEIQDKCGVVYMRKVSVLLRHITMPLRCMKEMVTKFHAHLHSLLLLRALITYNFSKFYDSAFEKVATKMF